MISKRFLSILTILSCALLLNTAPLQADDSWMKSFKEAKAKAKKEGKMVLIEFTGSDWCPPCKALAKHVMASAEFKAWAKKHVVLVYCDFPRRKKISKKQAKHNQTLQKKFKVRGYPTVIITDADGNEAGRKVGGTKDAAGYIQALTKIVKGAKKGKAKPKPASSPNN